MESFSVIVKFFRVKLRDKKRVRKMKKLQTQKANYKGRWVNA